MLGPGLWLGAGGCGKQVETHAACSQPASPSRPFPVPSRLPCLHPLPCLQVEALTAELAGVQEQAVDRGALEEARAAQQQAEARANALTAERESVAREVEAMQAALARLQAEAAEEGGARRRLGGVRATLEALRGEKAQLEGQLTLAEAKVAELRDRLEQREVKTGARRAEHMCPAGGAA